MRHIAERKLLDQVRGIARLRHLSRLDTNNAPVCVSKVR